MAMPFLQQLKELCPNEMLKVIVNIRLNADRDILSFTLLQ